MKYFMKFVSFMLCLAIMVAALTCVRVTITAGMSMEPTFHDGDLLIVTRYFGEPQVGDIVMVRHDSEFAWVKRIAAVAGESFDGTAVPEGHVYIVGDNLAESYDSRNPEIGPIPVEECWGKVIWTLRTED